MNKTDLEKFKNKLEKEKQTIEGELGTIGKSSNPDNPQGWEASSARMEVDPADENELADKMEELEDNEGILSNLEKQLGDVQNALEKIESGKYGKCEVCNGEIERARLEANPSARTCIEHMK